jgi:hypothetical protein
VKPPRRECDLSAPIQQYLAAQGYTVRCEVNDCDITAMRGDELVIVEMKRQFSTDLLIQAMERQRVAESVYVALPNEGDFDRGRARYAKRWRGIEGLLKRLELGLILVCFPDDPDAPPTIDVVQHPISEPRPRQKPAVRRTIIREISGRMAGDYNVGGSTGRALNTAYREQSVFIACCLERFGPLSPSKLRERFGTSPKTQSILFRNVYGWFERRERGVYGLRPAGLVNITDTFAGIAEFYGRKIDALMDASGPEMPSATPANDIIAEG